MRERFFWGSGSLGGGLVLRTQGGSITNDRGRLDIQSVTRYDLAAGSLLISDLAVKSCYIYVKDGNRSFSAPYLAFLLENRLNGRVHLSIMLYTLVSPLSLFRSW